MSFHQCDTPHHRLIFTAALRIMTMNTVPLAVPTVHLNGTSKDQLLAQLCDAGDALRSAITALANASPNARDYYPQGNSACRLAADQHASRMQRLESVLDELTEIQCALP